MSDYFSLLSETIHSPSNVYHTGTDKAWQEFEKNPESISQLTIKNSSTNMELED